MDMTPFVETIVPLDDSEADALRIHFDQVDFRRGQLLEQGKYLQLTKTTAGYMGADFMNNHYRIVSWYETLPAPQILQCLN
jgi:hypothetical protein